MKILIVGKNSFIGRGVGDWILKNEPQTRVDAISVRDNSWEEMDLTGYDAVLFSAAIVHRPEVKDWDTYERVNVQLPLRFARHAKEQGVGQFIFLSTVSVYHTRYSLPNGAWIGEDTPLAPTSLYGKSKLLAENGLRALANDRFCVSIIRPTYVYGKDCRGRHVAVQAILAKKLPLLPKAFENVTLGMVYIDNLAALCAMVAKSGCSGVYHAQDALPMSTAQILHTLAPEKKQICCQWLLRPFVRLSVMNRLFGGTAYTEALAKCPLGEYRLISMEEALRRTVT